MNTLYPQRNTQQQPQQQQQSSSSDLQASIDFTKKYLESLGIVLEGTSSADGTGADGAGHHHGSGGSGGGPVPFDFEADFRAEDRRLEHRASRQLAAQQQHLHLTQAALYQQQQQMGRRIRASQQRLPPQHQHVEAMQNQAPQPPHEQPSQQLQQQQQQLLRHLTPPSPLTPALQFAAPSITANANTNKAHQPVGGVSSVHIQQGPTTTSNTAIAAASASLSPSPNNKAHHHHHHPSNVHNTSSDSQPATPQHLVSRADGSFIDLIALRDRARVVAATAAAQTAQTAHNNHTNTTNAASPSAANASAAAAAFAGLISFSNIEHVSSRSHSEDEEDGGQNDEKNDGEDDDHDKKKNKKSTTRGMMKKTGAKNKGANGKNNDDDSRSSSSSDGSFSSSASDTTLERLRHDRRLLKMSLRGGILLGLPALADADLHPPNNNNSMYGRPLLPARRHHEHHPEQQQQQQQQRQGAHPAGPVTIAVAPHHGEMVASPTYDCVSAQTTPSASAVASPQLVQSPSSHQHQQHQQQQQQTQSGNLLPPPSRSDFFKNNNNNNNNNNNKNTPIKDTNEAGAAAVGTATGKDDDNANDADDDDDASVVIHDDSDSNQSGEDDDSSSHSDDIGGDEEEDEDDDEDDEECDSNEDEDCEFEEDVDINKSRRRRRGRGKRFNNKKKKKANSVSTIMTVAVPSTFRPTQYAYYCRSSGSSGHHPSQKKKNISSTMMTTATTSTKKTQQKTSHRRPADLANIFAAAGGKNHADPSVDMDKYNNNHRLSMLDGGDDLPRDAYGGALVDGDGMTAAIVAAHGCGAPRPPTPVEVALAFAEAEHVMIQLADDQARSDEEEEEIEGGEVHNKKCGNDQDDDGGGDDGGVSVPIPSFVSAAAVGGGGGSGGGVNKNASSSTYTATSSSFLSAPSQSSYRQQQPQQQQQQSSATLLRSTSSSAMLAPPPTGFVFGAAAAATPATTAATNKAANRAAAPPPPAAGGTMTMNSFNFGADGYFNGHYTPACFDNTYHTQTQALRGGGGGGMGMLGAAASTNSYLPNNTSNASYFSTSFFFNNNNNNLGGSSSTNPFGGGGGGLLSSPLSSGNNSQYGGFSTTSSYSPRGGAGGMGGGAGGPRPRDLVVNLSLLLKTLPLPPLLVEHMAFIESEASHLFALAAIEGHASAQHRYAQDVKAHLKGVKKEAKKALKQKKVISGLQIGARSSDKQKNGSNDAAQTTADSTPPMAAVVTPLSLTPSAAAVLDSTISAAPTSPAGTLRSPQVPSRFGGGGGMRGGGGGNSSSSKASTKPLPLLHIKVRIRDRASLVGLDVIAAALYQLFHGAEGVAGTTAATTTTTSATSSSKNSSAPQATGLVPTDKTVSWDLQWLVSTTRCAGAGAYEQNPLLFLSEEGGGVGASIDDDPVRRGIQRAIALVPQTFLSVAPAAAPATTTTTTTSTASASITTPSRNQLLSASSTATPAPPAPTPIAAPATSVPASPTPPKPLAEWQQHYRDAALAFVADRHREVLQHFYRIAFSPDPRHYLLYTGDEYTYEAETPIQHHSPCPNGFDYLVIKPQPIALRYAFPFVYAALFSSSRRALGRDVFPLERMPVTLQLIRDVLNDRTAAAMQRSETNNNKKSQRAGKEGESHSNHKKNKHAHQHKKERDTVIVAAAVPAIAVSHAARDADENAADDASPSMYRERSGYGSALLGQGVDGMGVGGGIRFGETPPFGASVATVAGVDISLSSNTPLQLPQQQQQGQEQEPSQSHHGGQERPWRTGGAGGGSGLSSLSASPPMSSVGGSSAPQGPHHLPSMLLASSPPAGDEEGRDAAHSHLQPIPAGGPSLALRRLVSSNDGDEGDGGGNSSSTRSRADSCRRRLGLGGDDDDASASPSKDATYNNPAFLSTTVRPPTATKAATASEEKGEGDVEGGQQQQSQKQQPQQQGFAGMWDNFKTFVSVQSPRGGGGKSDPAAVPPAATTTTTSLTGGAVVVPIEPANRSSSSSSSAASTSTASSSCSSSSFSRSQKKKEKKNMTNNVFASSSSSTIISTSPLSAPQAAKQLRHSLEVGKHPLAASSLSAAGAGVTDYRVQLTKIVTLPPAFVRAAVLVLASVEGHVDPVLELPSLLALADMMDDNGSNSNNNNNNNSGATMVSRYYAALRQSYASWLQVHHHHQNGGSAAGGGGSFSTPPNFMSVSGGGVGAGGKGNNSFNSVSGGGGGVGGASTTTVLTTAAAAAAIAAGLPPRSLSNQELSALLSDPHHSYSQSQSQSQSLQSQPPVIPVVGVESSSAAASPFSASSVLIDTPPAAQGTTTTSAAQGLFARLSSHQQQGEGFFTASGYWEDQHAGTDNMNDSRSLSTWSIVQRALPLRRELCAVYPHLSTIWSTSNNTTATGNAVSTTNTTNDTSSTSTSSGGNAALFDTFARMQLSMSLDALDAARSNLAIATRRATDAHANRRPLQATTATVGQSAQEGTTTALALFLAPPPQPQQTVQTLDAQPAISSVTAAAANPPNPPKHATATNTPLVQASVAASASVSSSAVGPPALLGRALSPVGGGLTTPSASGGRHLLPPPSATAAPAKPLPPLVVTAADIAAVLLSSNSSSTTTVAAAGSNNRGGHGNGAHTAVGGAAATTTTTAGRPTTPATTVAASDRSALLVGLARKRGTGLWADGNSGGSSLVVSHHHHHPSVKGGRSQPPTSPHNTVVPQSSATRHTATASTAASTSTTAGGGGLRSAAMEQLLAPELVVIDSIYTACAPPPAPQAPLSPSLSPSAVEAVWTAHFHAKIHHLSQRYVPGIAAIVQHIAASTTTSATPSLTAGAATLADASGAAVNEQDKHDGGDEGGNANAKKETTATMAADPLEFLEADDLGPVLTAAGRSAAVVSSTAVDPIAVISAFFSILLVREQQRVRTATVAAARVNKHESRGGGGRRSGGNNSSSGGGGGGDMSQVFARGASPMNHHHRSGRHHHHHHNSSSHQNSQNLHTHGHHQHGHHHARTNSGVSAVSFFSRTNSGANTTASARAMTPPLAAYNSAYNQAAAPAAGPAPAAGGRSAEQQQQHQIISSSATATTTTATANASSSLLLQPPPPQAARGMRRPLSTSTIDQLMTATTTSDRPGSGSSPGAATTGNNNSSSTSGSSFVSPLSTHAAALTHRHRRAFSNSHVMPSIVPAALTTTATTALLGNTVIVGRVGGEGLVASAGFAGTGSMNTQLQSQQSQQAPAQAPPYHNMPPGLLAVMANATSGGQSGLQAAARVVSSFAFPNQSNGGVASAGGAGRGGVASAATNASSSLSSSNATLTITGTGTGANHHNSNRGNKLSPSSSLLPVVIGPLVNPPNVRGFLLAHRAREAGGGNDDKDKDALSPLLFALCPTVRTVATLSAAGAPMLAPPVVPSRAAIIGADFRGHSLRLTELRQPLKNNHQQIEEREEQQNTKEEGGKARQEEFISLAGAEYGIFSQLQQQGDENTRKEISSRKRNTKKLDRGDGDGTNIITTSAGATTETSSKRASSSVPQQQQPTLSPSPLATTAEAALRLQQRLPAVLTAAGSLLTAPSSAAAGGGGGGDGGSASAFASLDSALRLQQLQHVLGHCNLITTPQSPADLTFYVDIKVKLPPTAAMYDAYVTQHNGTGIVSVRRAVVVPPELTADRLEDLILREIGIEIDAEVAVDALRIDRSSITSNNSASLKQLLPYFIFLKYGPLLELNIDQSFDFFGAPGAAMGPQHLSAPPAPPPAPPAQPPLLPGMPEWPADLPVPSSVSTIATNTNNNNQKKNHRHHTPSQREERRALRVSYRKALVDWHAQVRKTVRDYTSQAALHKYLTDLQQLHQQHQQVMQAWEQQGSGSSATAPVPLLRDRTMLVLRRLGVDTILVDLSAIPLESIKFTSALPKIAAPNTTTSTKQTAAGATPFSVANFNQPTKTAVNFNNNSFSGGGGANTSNPLGGGGGGAKSQSYLAINTALSAETIHESGTHSGQHNAGGSSGAGGNNNGPQFTPSSPVELWLIEQCRLLPSVVSPGARTDSTFTVDLTAEEIALMDQLHVYDNRAGDGGRDDSGFAPYALMGKGGSGGGGTPLGNPFEAAAALMAGPNPLYSLYTNLNSIAHGGNSSTGGFGGPGGLLGGGLSSIVRGGSSAVSHVITGATAVADTAAHGALTGLNGLIGRDFILRGRDRGAGFVPMHREDPNSSASAANNGSSGGGGATTTSGGGSALLLSRLDEDEAKAYQHFEVVKINKYGTRQQRVMGIDGERIYNMRPSSEVGRTKNPERNVSDVDIIATFPERPLYFEIIYRKEVRADTDCVECRCVADCILMVEKLRVLKRMNDRVKLLQMNPSAAAAAAAMQGGSNHPGGGAGGEDSGAGGGSTGSGGADTKQKRGFKGFFSKLGFGSSGSSKNASSTSGTAGSSSKKK